MPRRLIASSRCSAKTAPKRPISSGWNNSCVGFVAREWHAAFLLLHPCCAGQCCSGGRLHQLRSMCFLALERERALICFFSPSFWWNSLIGMRDATNVAEAVRKRGGHDLTRKPTSIYMCMSCLLHLFLILLQSVCIYICICIYI
jgi:hypothetical protein